MQTILTRVTSQVSSLCSHDTFVKWLHSQTDESSFEVAFNNSFLYRQQPKPKTTKSDWYLGMAFADAKPSDILVYANHSQNDDFKVISLKSSNQKRTTIAKLLPKMLSEIGKLVFVLIGSIDESEVFSFPINSKFLGNIVLNRAVQSNVMSGSDVLINDTTDEEAIWTLITTALSGTEGFAGNEDEVREKFGQALAEIDKKAFAKLRMPLKDAKVGSGILDQLVSVLDSQISEYEGIVSKIKSDKSVPSDVLRIAYNFASDATTMISLLISVCDLKPVVFWCTIYEHFLLSEAFKSLPWLKSKYKASLQGYIDTIGDARNSAFHKLFPFRQAVEVDLPDDSIRDPVLRIFSEYSRKKENELTYQDKELVSVFTEFTRTSTTKVSKGFWTKNLDVMKATRDLFASTSEALKIIHSQL